MKKVVVRKPTPKPADGGTALLVIDVQQELFDKSTPVYQAEAMLKNINLLVERAHLSGVPVIYVQHSAEKMLLKGTPGWQLHPALHPQPEDGRVCKLHGNAFEDTPLEEMLQAQNVSTVVACGLVSYGCVRATCLGALELGYRVILAADAHSNYSKDAVQQIEKTHKLLDAAGVERKAAAEIAFGG